MTRFLCLSMFIFSCAGQSKVASPPLGSDNEAAVEKKSVEATPVQSLVRLAGSIEIVTIKNETAPVPLQIQSFEASLLGVESADGVFEFEDAALVLPLAAINSGLDIRDQRIRETFFHADQNPNARFEIARLILDSPTVPTSAKFEGKLVIGAFSQALIGSFVAAEPVEGAEQPRDGAVNLVSAEPMVVSIDALGMGERLKALIELCGHQSVADTVQVSAKGTFSVTPSN